MDYLGQIIERANDKNEAIKQQVTGVMPESERPFNVEDRLTASYTFGQRVADSVARFGGSWTFIISFILMMAIWMLINVLHPFGWNFDPLSFHLAQSSTFYDCGDSSSFDHDEPKQGGRLRSLASAK